MEKEWKEIGRRGEGEGKECGRSSPTVVAPSEVSTSLVRGSVCKHLPQVLKHFMSL